MIWSMPEWTFGPRPSGRLGVTIYRFGPNACRRLSGRLALPPSNQQPATTTTTNLGYLNVRLTRAKLGQAKTTRLIEGLRRAGYAQRSKVTP